MVPNNNISRLVALVLAKVRGTLSDKDRKEYDDVIKNSKLSELDKKFDNTQFLVDKLTQHSKFDSKAAFAQFRRETTIKTSNSKKRNVWFATVAAVVVLGLVIGTIVSSMVDKRRRDNTMELAQNILPGKQCAQMTLANGQVIDLSDSVVDMTIDGVGSIKTEDGAIVYSSMVEAPEDVLAQNKLTVPRGGECVMMLDDGTKVWLNSDSKLEYPVKFSGKERRVKIEGEVMFNVVHNENMPFVVESPNITLTVRGTTFNLRDYPEEGVASASLVSGRIEVDNVDGTSKVILAPGYQAISKNGSVTIDVKKVDPGVITGWTENKFSFWQQDLDDVLSDVSRWYDITVEYDGGYKGNYSLTGKIPRDCTLKEVLELLEMITNAEFVFYDRTLKVKANR